MVATSYMKILSSHMDILERIPLDRPRGFGIPKRCAAAARIGTLLSRPVLYAPGESETLEVMASKKPLDTRRLLEAIGHIPPAEAEDRYYAELEETRHVAAWETQANLPPGNPARFKTSTEGGFRDILPSHRRPTRLLDGVPVANRAEVLGYLRPALACSARRARLDRKAGNP